jgi:hypothetical protein
MFGIGLLINYNFTSLLIEKTRADLFDLLVTTYWSSVKCCTKSESKIIIHGSGTRNKFKLERKLKTKTEIIKNWSKIAETTN